MHARLDNQTRVAVACICCELYSMKQDARVCFLLNKGVQDTHQPWPKFSSNLGMLSRPWLLWPCMAGLPLRQTGHGMLLELAQ
jgi:hypothetical protein